jgi:hypothetical protein
MLYGIGHLGVLFNEYNGAYFGNILPMPSFRIMHSVDTLGYFSYIPGSVPGTTEIIEMSDFYDYTESQLRDVLVHEMIHYYLSYIGVEIYPSLGHAFMNVAQRLNRTYGMNVTPTIDLKKYKPRYNTSFLQRLYFWLIT